MYAVINHLHLKSSVDDLAKKIQAEGAPLLATNLGFQAVHFIKHDETHCTVLILWDDQASAEAGARAFGPTWFARNIGPLLASEQQRTAGEVVVSRHV